MFKTKNFLAIILSTLVLTGCFSSSRNVKVDADIYPSFTEVITLGLVTDSLDEEKALEKKIYDETFVEHEKDKRNVVEKSLHEASMGLFFLPETKEQYAERIAKEKEEEKRYVTADLDDRNALDKTIYWITNHKSVAPETWTERELRLKKEQQEKEERKYKFDKRSVLEKNIDTATMGMWQPGKPASYVPKNAAGKEDWLDAIVYGISTYDDVVVLLGKPVKQVIQATGEKTSTFVYKKETFKRVPYIGKKRKTIDFKFDKNGLLKFPDESMAGNN